MLNKQMKEELNAKGALGLVIEAVALVGVMALCCGSLYLIAAIGGY